MFDLTAVGEMLIDFTPVGAPGRPDTYQANPGGAPANTASLLLHSAERALLSGKSARIRLETAAARRWSKRDAPTAF